MKESRDFVDLAGLSGETFSNISLDGILINIYDFANTVWLNPRMYSFVDHGLDHSFRVLQLALNIFDRIAPAGSKLSPLERLVITIGALIHDIGMQYNKYPVGGVTKDPLDIRKHHCELGFEMIKDVREGNFSAQRSGPTLALEEYNKMFLHYGALVGFSHSGRKYWDLLKDSVYEQRVQGGLQILRLRLLAALLRLGDELHCEHTRVSEPSWVTSPLLNEEEKAHWVACYYTQEIKMSSPSPGGAALRMIMKWRVPESQLDDDIQLIRTLLQDLREKKVNQEIEIVEDYLRIEEKSEACVLRFLMDTNPEKIDIQRVPQQVKEYIVKKLRPYQFGFKTLSSLEKVKEVPSSSKIDSVKYRAQKFFLTANGVFSGHFRLKTGWHTNKYVRCRDLCSDIDFVTDLCQELKTFYSQYKFSDVLAIGTSSIRLGSLLSFLMAAKLSYTFGRVHIQSTLVDKKDYTDYEMELLPFDNGNILVIDDILGVGSVIHDLIGKLRDSTSPPNYIRVFTLYSLGDVKKLVQGIPDVYVDYLASFPDVEYREEDKNTGTCEVCINHPEIIKIEE